MKKKLVLLFLATFLGLSACKPVKPLPDTTDTLDSYDGPSTTCANIVMGGGDFAYHNNFIYFNTRSGIGEYDLLSKESVIIPSKNHVDSSLYIDDNYIYFAQSDKKGLIRMTKDGKKAKSIYEGASGYRSLYLTQTHAYYLDFMDGSLFRYNFETSTEEELCSIRNGYFVEGNTIYALADHNDAIYLYQSDINDIDFQHINLSFSPIAVLAVDDTLYLTKKGVWEVVMVKDGKETTLPIRSLNYQVLGNQLFYQEEVTNMLKSYNLDTGEIRTIFENDFWTFCVLAERYIGISNSNNYYLYDLETETLELMYPQEGA